MVLVDSSAWIEGLRRKGRIEVKLALEGLLDEDKTLLCDPVRLEILGGARRNERRRLGQCLAVIPFRRCSAEDWENAIALAWRLRDHGVTVPWLDVLIAAIALQDRIPVYAVDRHFPEIAEHTGLRLYEPGYGGSYNP